MAIVLCIDLLLKAWRLKQRRANNPFHYRGIVKNKDFDIGLVLEQGFLNLRVATHLGSRSKIMGSRVIKIQFNKKCFLTCKIIVIKKNNNHRR